MINIPFNKPFINGKEIEYILEAHSRGHLAGDGLFTKHCHSWLEKHTGCIKALLTHSCTAALEMAAILINIQPGDEIIMPSYTFVSTANAFVLRGGVPVFVDIRPDTLNLDESKIEAAITPKTKAIVPVHYAGVGCEMDVIMAIAKQYGLFVVEDSAQGIMASYKGRRLGSIGHLAACSFHETKNIISGEGGALIINDPVFIEQAEVTREKGTNRSRFLRGQVDKYTWIGIGSSFLPSELTAAFLWAQMQEADTITQRRLMIWETYHTAFKDIEKSGKIRRPIVPDYCNHNAHMYYLLLPNHLKRIEFIAELKRKGFEALFHYVPLHSSPAGQKYGRSCGTLIHTNEMSERLIRLPLWLGLEENINEVIDTIEDVL